MTIIESSARRLNIKHVAGLISCSERHTDRMARSGRMPKPAKLGKALRWSQTELEEWVAGGCPDLRQSQKNC